MSSAPHENSGSLAPDSYSFDADADIVAGHLKARAMDRWVLLGCSLIGSIGIAILLFVLATSALTPAIGVNTR
jgi:hypothetical protein